MMLVVVKQTGISLIETCFLIIVVIYHKSVTLGGSTEHFTTKNGFKVMAYSRGLQSMSHGPDAVREAISTGP